MGLFENFPYVNFHKINLDWILQKIKSLESAVAALAVRMTAAEEDIDALEGRMDTAEADIDALEGRMDTAEDDIDTLQTRMTDAEEELLDHNDRIVELEADNIRIWNTVSPSRAWVFDDTLSEAQLTGYCTRTNNILTITCVTEIPDSNVSHKVYFREECGIPLYSESDPDIDYRGNPQVLFTPEGTGTTGIVYSLGITAASRGSRPYFEIPAGYEGGYIHGSVEVIWRENPPV